MGILMVILALAILMIYVYIDKKNHDKVMRDGRPVMAMIEHASPVSADDSGNTTIAYTLKVEGRRIYGKTKINTFYAPQFQPGMEIEIMYIDDGSYSFLFKR